MSDKRSGRTSRGASPQVDEMGRERSAAAGGTASSFHHFITGGGRRRGANGSKDNCGVAGGVGNSASGKSGSGGGGNGKKPLNANKKNKDTDSPNSTSSSSYSVGSTLGQLWKGIRQATTSLVSSHGSSSQSISKNQQLQMARSNPNYHSEGKGARRKKNSSTVKENRRHHSFNEPKQLKSARKRSPFTNGFDTLSKPQPSALRSSLSTMMSARSTPNLQQPSSARPSNDSSTISKAIPSNASSVPHSNPSIYSYLHTQSGLNFAPVPVPAACVNSLSSSSSSITSRESSPPPTPPVRDSSSLKSVKYGPGHEKFPSWPVPAAAEAPQALRGPPSGGSHRSKSWTDHTNYPKEKVVTYTRPYMKRQHSAYAQQKLKTVMEKCEKFTTATSAESFDSRLDKIANDRLAYLPRVDREGKALGDLDYMVPSPPERDLTTKPQLTQADLEEYARSYQQQQDPSLTSEMDTGYQDSLKGTSMPHLTQADLEEYTRSYEESLHHQHQKQPSYAQSEGYHSYVSSTDSTSTPFLDRLRRDSEVVTTRPQSSTSAWDDLTSEQMRREGGRDSVVTTSSGSVSSSETLKWHGSMSDVSVASSSCTHLASNSSSRQLIAHSARVQTPQRHHSESVLYMGSGTDNGGAGIEGWKDRETRNNNHNNKLKLFPVNTYTVQPSEQQQSAARLSSMSSQPSLSVADRVSELEKQTKYTYLDPDKKHRVSDPTLKAIQKKALLSFYERHHSNSSSASGKSSPWRSEPQLAAQSLTTVSIQNASIASSTSLTTYPVQAPVRPRLQQTPSRRASSASDYKSSASRRSSVASSTCASNLREAKTTESLKSLVAPRHQHSNSCGSLSADLLGPVIMGPAISVDDWVPERPPKNAQLLRAAYPDLFISNPPRETIARPDQRESSLRRLPSPDLPPPSPPTVSEDEVIINNDEPLPPPPPEVQMDTDGNCGKAQETDWQQEFNDRLKENTASCRMNGTSGYEGKNEPLVKNGSSPNKNITRLRSSNSAMANQGQQLRGAAPTHTHKSNTSEQCTKQQSSPLPSPKSVVKSKAQPQQQQYFTRSNKPQTSLDFASSAQRAYSGTDVGRSSTRYPSTQKLVLNGSGNIAVSQKVVNGISAEHRAEPLRARPLERPPAQLPPPNVQRASIAASSGDEMPPPLQPRQMRVNQSMRARIPDSHRQQRTSPPKDDKLRDPRPPLSYTMSQSKASYLASRRDRERGVPNADTGSYKRTMSPGGNTIVPPADNTTTNGTTMSLVVDNSTKGLSGKDVSREHLWQSNNRNNNNLLLRRSSLSGGKSKKMLDQDVTNVVVDEEKKVVQCVLPDVLPVSAKHFTTRPSQLSLNLVDPIKSSHHQQHSPTKGSPIHGSPLNSPLNSRESTPTKTQQQSPLRLSPASSVNSPLRNSPLSVQSNPPAPLRTSPLRSPPAMTTAATTTPARIRTSPISLSSNLRTSPLRISHPSSVSSASSTTSSGSISPPKTPLTSPPRTPTSPVPSLLRSKSKSPEFPGGAVEPNKVCIEGLQMIQRTEVILRVNACTIDAASQTEKEELGMMTPLPTRRKLQEEIDCEKLSQDLVNQLSPSDRLKCILVPGPDHKKPTDYVSGLFRIDVTSRPRPANSPFRSRNNTPSSSPPPTATQVSTMTTTLTDTSNSTADSSPAALPPSLEPSSPLSATSTYFTTSESKAKFLTRYSRDMSQFTSIVKDTKDLKQQKEELVSRLDRKLEVLRSEQLVVEEECRVNDELGENVDSHVTTVARPHETAKYRLHVEEVGKITSLLLGLSGRLARAENALMGLPEEHSEKKILEGKRDKLLDQLEEAKKLKESIDKRSVSVSNMLYQYLNSEEYADYDHFINMKAKLIMDSREIADKIKLGEEQLLALKETLVTD